MALGPLALSSGAYVANGGNSEALPEFIVDQHVSPGVPLRGFQVRRLQGLVQDGRGARLGVRALRPPVPYGVVEDSRTTSIPASLPDTLERR